MAFIYTRQYSLIKDDGWILAYYPPSSESGLSGNIREAEAVRRELASLFHIADGSG